MTDLHPSISPRVLAIAALAFFIPVMVSFAVAPGVWWINYPGIFFHLALFLMVSRLEAPQWAKAAGYGWLLLDIAAGVMTMDNVEHNIAYSERYGGHIFAGIWIVTVSLRGSLPVRITGVLAGSILFLYSFVARFVPPGALSSTSILILLWLGFIAWQNGVRRTDSLTRTTAR
ncbi:hypothetical protein [Sphingomonas bacterium]|uniref:hypothetical protein n=1 Tax=Sphingomonas bacterium TaxID=1895847 RepID=UPI0015765A8C|nr:hypothetical protein [Sphingomonas bacterium]